MSCVMSFFSCFGTVFLTCGLASSCVWGWPGSSDDGRQAEQRVTARAKRSAGDDGTHAEARPPKRHHAATAPSEGGAAAVAAAGNPDGDADVEAVRARRSSGSPKSKGSRSSDSLRSLKHLFPSGRVPGTYDTSFKYLMESDEIVTALMQLYVPQLRDKRITRIERHPVALPVVPHPDRKTAEQVFMDAYCYAVTAEGGAHVVVEMQCRREVMGDERFLYYACGTYAGQRQFWSASQQRSQSWFHHLEPVVAIQILDYSSAAATGIVERDARDNVRDTLIARQSAHPMEAHQYVKHYVMKEKLSGQEVDHLQMVQVELPGAAKEQNLWPLSKKVPESLSASDIKNIKKFHGFTDEQWLLSLLRYGDRYQKSVLEGLKREKVRIPPFAQEMLKRLTYHEWRPEMQEAVLGENEMMRRYAHNFTQARYEGRAEGRAEGRREARIQSLKDKLEAIAKHSAAMARCGADVTLEEAAVNLGYAPPAALRAELAALQREARAQESDAEDGDAGAAAVAAEPLPSSLEAEALPASLTPTVVMDAAADM